MKALSILALLMACLMTINCQAACYRLDATGRRWVTTDNLKGTTTATIKQCETIDYQPKISANNPLYVNIQQKLFDPTFGGIRLSINALPDQSEPCLFLKPTLADGKVGLQMYDATRVAADGTESCNP